MGTDPIVGRRWVWRMPVTMWFVFVVWGLIPVGCVVGVGVRDAVGTSRGVSVWFYAWLVITLVSSTVLYVVFARPRLVADAEGLELRPVGFGRDRVFTWREVRGVLFPVQGGAPPNLIATDGEFVWLWPLAVGRTEGGPVGADRPQRIVGVLTVLAQHEAVALEIGVGSRPPLSGATRRRAHVVLGVGIGLFALTMLGLAVVSALLGAWIAVVVCAFAGGATAWAVLKVRRAKVTVGDSERGSGTT
jgi:hypothetical protein